MFFFFYLLTFTLVQLNMPAQEQVFDIKNKKTGKVV